MSTLSNRKIFLKRLAASWRQEFPFLRPVDLPDEIPRTPKGCNFVCDDYSAARACYYFVRIEFLPKLRNQFMIAITVSPSPTRSVLGPAMVSKPTAKSIGSFTVAKFLNKPRFEWALFDDTAQAEAFLDRMGTPIRSRNRWPENVWRPSSFAKPMDLIADEAIAHVNRTLRSSVFPVIEIG